MSDNESDDSSTTLHSESEMSEDSDSSEGSIKDFVVDDSEELEVCVSCRAEICPSNVITNKRRRVEVDHETYSNSDEGGDKEGDSDDSSSDYVPSEAGDSSEDESSAEDE